MSGNNERFWMVLALVVIVVLSLYRPYCTAENSSSETLTASGYKEVRLDGWGGPFVCGQDPFATDFIAKSPGGNVVNGTVCCGLLKGCTVRH